MIHSFGFLVCLSNLLNAATILPFTYKVENWSTQPSPNQYVAQTNNISVHTESSPDLDFWSANSSGSASLTMHFDMNQIMGVSDFEIQKAQLYVPVTLFDWSSPDPTGVLSASTDGTNWTELRRATAGVVGPTESTYGFSYGTVTTNNSQITVNPEDIAGLGGQEHIWLKFEFTNVGYTNTAQMGRSLIGSGAPAFQLSVNAVPEPSSILLIALSSLTLLRRHRQ